jgi:transposase
MPDEQFGSGFWRSFVWWQPVLKKSGSTPLERLIFDSRPGRAAPSDKQETIPMAARQETKAEAKPNRKQRREQHRRIWTDNPGLDVVHPDAAGIDIGNSEHYVAIAPGKSEEPVRKFGCFTNDLRELARFLKAQGIRSVAMQSTGVYWIPLYDVLEEEEFEVYLVNARDTKNLPGRKSDVQESQWLLKLHTYGLLRNSFRPTSEIRVLRTYWRQRSEHVQTAGECVQRMQKSLTQMNLQLANVISDIMGVTGQKILRAILAGERDAEKLAEMRHERIQASREEIVGSLTGNWRPELLFGLKQEMDRYDFCQRQIAECDQQIERHLGTFPGRPKEMHSPDQPWPPPQKKKKKRAGGNSPAFALDNELARITGVDFTRIEGINVMTAQTILSEVGLDRSQWKTEAHFASWLGLCPNNSVTGGKVLRRGTRKIVNRAATAFRIAASTLRRSESYLGAQFRRFRTRLGAPKAITAMAHKLAVLFYRMLRYGQEYLDRGQQFYQDKYRQQQIAHLNKQAAQLGLVVATAAGLVVSA